MEKTYTKKALTYELATKMVEAAVARAKELGVKQNVAVVDEGGNLKAFGRMDGAPLLGVEGCQRKAYTALFGFGTADFYNAIKGDPSLVVGLSHFSRATVVGGGLPVIVDGEVIGGIGVGGGTVEQDIDCAQTGLKVLSEE
ncbi:MAG: heme-binding protein [Nitrospinae bacterium]|nr:heme-binding protein [Nitrospinota bacterium]